MSNYPKIERAVCHVCGFSWSVRGGKFTNHHRMLRGKTARCAGSRAEPEMDAIAAAFGRPQPVADPPATAPKGEGHE